MLQSPGEFKSEDLPKKTMPNWKMAGPGAILVGLSIGAGEIVIWPRIATFDLNLPLESPGWEPGLNQRTSSNSSA